MSTSFFLFFSFFSTWNKNTTLSCIYDGAQCYSWSRLALKYFLNTRKHKFHQQGGEKNEGHDFNSKQMMERGKIRHPEGWQEPDAAPRALGQPCSQLDLPERPGPEFPFSTRPAGTALLLLLKERWDKRPACEEQEGRGGLEKVASSRVSFRSRCYKSDLKYTSYLYD